MILIPVLAIGTIVLALTPYAGLILIILPPFTFAHTIHVIVRVCMMNSWINREIVRYPKIDSRLKLINVRAMGINFHC